MSSQKSNELYEEQREFTRLPKSEGTRTAMQDYDPTIPDLPDGQEMPEPKEK